MKASSFYQTQPASTTKLLNNNFPSATSDFTGIVLHSGLTGSITGALCSLTHSDDDWHSRLDEYDVSGTLKGLCCVATAGNFTSGDTYGIRVYTDGGASHIFTNTITITAAGQGIVVAGSVADDGAGNKNVIGTGSVKFNSRLLIQVRTIRAGATSKPYVYCEIEYS